MQGHDLSRCGECAVAVVALGAAQGDKMAICRDVILVAGDAGDSNWRWSAGEVLALFNGIFDCLVKDGVAVAHNAIALMDGIDTTHIGRNMTKGDTAGGDGNHIVLLGCRWDGMICLVFLSVAVGAILELT